AEVSFEDVAASRRRITLEFFPGDEALADQLGVLDRRLEATIGGRWFAVREGGEPAARAWLLGSDAVGQVEDVATAPDRRRTGLAQRLLGEKVRGAVERRLGLLIGDELPELRLLLVADRLLQ